MNGPDTSNGDERYDSTELAGAQRPTNMRWWVFALGCGMSLFLYMHRYAFAIVKPKLMEEWGVSKTELGAMDSAFSLGYSVFQFPAGVLADITGAHLFLGAAIIVWSLAFGLHAWAPGISAMWYVRGLFGAGQAGCFAAVNRIARTWFPFRYRTTVQGWMGISFGRLGGVCAYFLFGAVMLGMLKIEWRTGVYILALAGVMHGLLFLLLFRNSPRKHPWVNRAEADLIEDVAPPVDTGPTAGKTDQIGNVPVVPAKRMPVREMFRRMSPRSILNLLSLNVQSILSTMADNIFSNWIPLFLAEVHALKFSEMGIYSMLPLIGGAFGGAIGGWLNDTLIRRTGSRRWSRSLVGFAGKSIAGVLILAALLWYDNPYQFCAMLFFVKLFSDWSLTSSWGTVADISGKATASVYAFNNSVAGIGSFTAPLIFGIVADNVGWKLVFIVGAGMYFLCALSWLVVNCTIPVLREENRRS